jgi:Glycosyl transferase family 2
VLLPRTRFRIMNSTLQQAGRVETCVAPGIVGSSQKVLGMATVDVVIPGYNYAQYVNDCVRSVHSQSAVTVRLVVIDDAFTDNTTQIGQELAASDNRVKFHRRTVNRVTSPRTMRG